MHDWLAQRVAQRPWREEALPQPLAIEQLPTPALLLDRAAFERNLAKMQAHIAEHGKAIRPHSKTHKSPLIAHQQIAAGAVGICAAKLGEALVMAQAGVPDILLTSPLTHPDKLALVSQIARATDLAMVVDSQLGAERLLEQLESDVALRVVLDIDVEMGRTGNRHADDLRRIADTLAADRRITVAGVQHYAGHLMHVEQFVERRDRSLAAWERAVEIGVEVLGAPTIVTGGGTGTFDIDVEVEAITDLQVGSYIFMDREYLQIEGSATPQFTAFESSLSVVCSVISEPLGGPVTVDGGYKAFASDTVAPLPTSLADAKYRFAGDEHGVLIPNAGSQQPLLGDVATFMVPHCDPTVNLHDYYWVRDPDGMIRSVWPVAARGCAW